MSLVSRDVFRERKKVRGKREKRVGKKKTPPTTKTKKRLCLTTIDGLSFCLPLGFPSFTVSSSFLFFFRVFKARHAMETLARLTGFGEDKREGESDVKKERALTIAADGKRFAGQRKSQRHLTPIPLFLSLLQNKNRCLRPGAGTREGHLRRQVRVFLEESQQRAHLIGEMHMFRFFFFSGNAKDGSGDGDGDGLKHLSFSLTHARHSNPEKSPFSHTATTPRCRKGQTTRAR